MVTLNLTMLNVRGVRDPRECSSLLDELLKLRVDVAAVQETHFTWAMDYHLLEDHFVVFSAAMVAFGSLC